MAYLRAPHDSGITMYVRHTLKELGELATREIGFCVGIYWRSVTGRCVPEGQISASCRLAYVLFTGFAPAERFYDLLTRKKADRLPRHKIRLVQVTHNGQTATGVAVIAIVSPDSAHTTGFRRAPACAQQPGYHRYFRMRALADTPKRPWWDSELGDDSDDGRFEPRELRPGRDDDERRADEDLERELDRLEAEYDAKLWWYGAPGRWAKYPPKLGSVRELFAYARRQELEPEEFACRNREKQTKRWLSEQHLRDRQRQQQIDADQAEIAVALSTPRRGRAHVDDQDWLATEQALKARKGMKHLYRDAAPRPSRPTEV
ncbi:MAG: hypothetical protein HGA45_11215 [Chloroflexales bacterium]|nr:hypothetical protein [Chloroflexales bacterium]